MMPKRHWMLCGGVLAAVALALLAVSAAWAQGPPRVGDWSDFYSFFSEEPIKPSDHWIGVDCHPAGEALRAQLNLPEDQGLLVQQVVDESPAARAGLLKYDVLLLADDEPLSKKQDLVDAVDAAKDGELTLGLVRGGKPMQVKVKPEKRPESPPPIQPPKGPGGPPWDQLRKWFERDWPDDLRQAPRQFRFWGPGTILPPDFKLQPPLPGNMSVTVTRKGDNPAEIVVKRDGETWEVTENDLDKLPEDIRPHVERMLGRLGPGAADQIQSFDFTPDWGPRWKAWPEGRLDERFEEMNRRIDELRKSIEEMRPRRKPPEFKPEEVPAPKLNAPDRTPENV